MDRSHLIDSVSIPLVIWNDKNLNPTEKILLTDIIGLIRSGRKCFKSNQSFADLVGLSRDRASKIISDLSKRGYIKVSFDKKSSSNFDKRIITLSSDFRKKLLGGLAFEDSSTDTKMTETEEGGIVTSNQGYSYQQLGGIVTSNSHKKSIEEVNKESLISNEESVDSSGDGLKDLFGGKVESTSKPKSKKKEKGSAARAHAALLPIETFYKEDYFPDFKYNYSRDRKQINEIIDQIEKMMLRRGQVPTTDSVIEFFKITVQNAPAFYQKKSLTYINDKLAEMVEEIKKKRNGQSTTSQSRRSFRDLDIV